jgi:methylsterol monooxygenase
MGLASWWPGVLEQYSSFEIMVVGLLSMTVGTYYLFGGAHLLLDIWHRPASLYRTKLQPTRPFDQHLLGSLLFNLVINQLFVLLPAGIASWYFRCRILETEATCLGGPELPSVLEVLRDLIVFILVEEVLFFYSHFLLHRRELYDAIHRKHHEFRSPIALAAAYCHPIEMLVANVLPLALGPILMRSHLLTTAIWYFIAIVGTQSHHCGYQFPWFFGNQPKMHDLHHETYTSNFGLLGILDWLHGTYVSGKRVQ